MIVKSPITYVNVKKVKAIYFCGRPIMWELKIDGFYKAPERTNPTKGKHDFNTCKDCQTNRSEMLEFLTARFEGRHKKGALPFPFCCSNHSNLFKNKVKGYNINSFINAPELVSDKLIYTRQHIINNHSKNDYYKEITDYIEYTIMSFGQMPNNCGEPLYLDYYFGNVIHFLEQLNKISKERKSILLEYMQTWVTPSQKEKNTDLNILIKTYEKWFKLFPFEISFFKEIKPHYEKIPLFNGKPEVNKYTGLEKLKTHTKSSLIDFLLNLTNTLITQINSVVLYEKGLLTKPNNIKLELVLNERKMKLKQGYVNNSQDEEQRYRKILKEWFADEKRFIDEIIPLLESVKLQNKSQFSIPEWTTIFYYADETKLLPHAKTKIKRMEQFIKKHSISTTIDSFKSKYYEAKKRINEKNDYPIDKLQLILSFIKANYKQATTAVENDISHLQKEKIEKEKYDY